MAAHEVVHPEKTTDPSAVVQWLMAELGADWVDANTMYNEELDSQADMFDGRKTAKRLREIREGVMH
jgi:hypothetical protein